MRSFVGAVKGREVSDCSNSSKKLIWGRIEWSGVCQGLIFICDESFGENKRHVVEQVW